jgi:predicted anti-sigma-YlaC factor YlaD
MHGSIRDRLEDLLGAERLGADRPVLRRDEIGQHVTSCSECSSELETMKQQAQMLRSLKAPGEFEPSAGFYARVMQRIEERTKDSIWSAFVYSRVGTRLAYASFALVVVLGSYVVAHESRDGHLRGESMIAQSFHYDAPVTGDQTQQRDAVLENFASH